MYIYMYIFVANYYLSIYMFYSICLLVASVHVGKHLLTTIPFTAPGNEKEGCAMNAPLHIWVFPKIGVP